MRPQKIRINYQKLLEEGLRLLLTESYQANRNMCMYIAPTSNTILYFDNTIF